MADRTVSATRFRVECLRLIDEVAETGRSVTVTKHGKPLVRLVAVDGAASLIGSVTFLVGDDELIEPVGERWDAVSADSSS